MRNKAVFLDRDGTIIEDRGYLSSPKEVVFYNNSFEALRKLQDHYKLFIVTNQSGIAKGFNSPEEVQTVNTHVCEILREQGIHITDIYVCPHNKEDRCQCKKPKPFFLEQAAKKYHLDLQKSFSIGDHPCDVQLAERKGGKGIFVLTGHGKKHVHELSGNEIIAQDLSEAANIIMSCDE